MQRLISRAAFAAFLFSVLVPAYAVPVIFRNSNGVLIRNKSGSVEAKPGVAELLESVPDYNGGATARMEQGIDIGGAESSATATRGVSAGDIAATAAGLMMGGGAAGTVAGLALELGLPYLLGDDGQLKKEETPSPSPSEPDPTQVGNAGCAYCFSWTASNITKATYDSQVAARMPASCGATTPITQTQYIYSTGNIGYRYMRDTQIICQLIVQAANRKPDVCTGTGQTYDPATGMCLGSAMLVPANREQLEQDIADTFASDPTKAPNVMDKIMEDSPDTDFQNASPTSVINDPAPVDGPTETSVQNTFDPATGHPVEKTTQKHTQYDPQVEPAGGNTVVIKEITTTTETIRDTVTNNVITNTTVTNTEKGDANQKEEDYTFNASPGEYDPTIEPPDKTPLPPMLNEMKGQITTWANGIGIEASGTCSMPVPFSIGGHSGSGEISFCEFESQIAAIGAIILSFAVLYGGFIVMGVRE